jgi:hypothetical protein
MTTHFITAEIDINEQPLTVEKITKEIEQHGDPLRWAVTAVDKQKQTAQVEAVVTRNDHDS